MPDHFRGITDRFGRPIEKSVLAETVAAPTLAGVRSPLTGYPGDGLDPVRLANILREADRGDPLRYLELAQTIEERDLHYVGVLGTRRRSVSQLDITVEPADDSALAVDQAAMVEDWLKRDELADEIFDMLDAIGKGYSFTEIIWDSSSGQWRPDRLEFCDPRYFRFERRDLATPLLIDEHGAEQPLPGFKFVFAVMKAKSGLALRSGLARIVAWAWMFKAYTQRDWAIFTQNYGQPIRLGKYGPGATEDDRATLYRAIANIGGDMAAMVPESMAIEFVEAKSAGTAHVNYRARADWLDQQVSKAVLGQTATTDAIAGGHAVGREHRQVQEDIERADAKALTAILNRDLVRPWIELERGRQESYPRIRIGRADETDVKMVVEAVDRLVPRGLKVGQKQMRDIIGLAAPEDGDELLSSPSGVSTPLDPSPPGDPPSTPLDASPSAVPASTPLDASRSAVPASTPLDPSRRDDPGDDPAKAVHAASKQEARSAGGATGTQKEARSAPGATGIMEASPLDLIAGQAAADADAATRAMLATVEAIIAGASTLEEMRAMLEAAAAAGRIGTADLETVMNRALLAAELTGRAEISR